ncbi:S1C family serine protease [Butyrivibrio sp. YAB3001]|uniref:S1C family serine protease n=1 Tax=Butyrivibrio sp. YAB3001 TaxID=1520812 RepID=UPI0008F68569|nr:trypsin-like peptidase domain-containing protein [Butyrivibrio sp. YAB3001]SFC20472.1 serine protease Do [Butyrivibrio sp. YAB3001]
MYEDDKREQGGVNYNSYLNSQSNNNSYGNGQSGNNNYSYGNPYSYGNGQQQSGYNYGNGGNNYSYNNPQGGQTYGTYQYGMADNVDSAQGPVKKKHTAGIVVAALVIVALIVGGVGASYYAISNHIFDKEDSQQLAVEENDEKEADNEVAEAETEKQVKTTTVTAETKAVVTDVTAVVQEVMPAMVIIHNNYTQSVNYFGFKQTQEATASGSGVIVGENDTELLIATNHHVIEGADSLEVIFNDETTVEAFVKGSNSDIDLAVIAVLKDDLSSDTLDTIKVATLGDSDGLVLGEPAIAIGNALGYGQSVTTGVISALNRTIELEDGSERTFIQTDAAINPGNSGGALLNLQGEVVGINSNKLGGTTVEGMGYAIPISDAKPIIEELMNEETMIRVSEENRGYIGISGVTVTSEVSQVYGLPQGVYVAEVANGGGADNAGIAKGDVIVGFEDAEITSMEDLQTKLQYYAIGTTVQVTVLRQNGSEYEEIVMDVTLGGAASNNGSEAEASDEGNVGQYDGKQAPGKPEDRDNGNSSSQGGH